MATAEPMESTSDLDWTFGDRLRKVRRVHHLTQKQLAAQLHVTSAVIDAWECDRSKPRSLVAMATRIELALGLPRGWMLGYAELINATLVPGARELVEAELVPGAREAVQGGVVAGVTEADTRGRDVTIWSRPAAGSPRLASVHPIRPGISLDARSSMTAALTG